MKFLSLLIILLLCTDCGPEGLPTAETSSTHLATQTSQAASQPTSSHLPTPTAMPTWLPPTPIPMFEGLIDALAIDPQGTLFAGGYGPPSDGSRRLARWDGTEWIAMETGFEPDGSPLAIDSAGQLYSSGLTAIEHGMATVMVKWDGAQWEDITGNFSTVVDALQAGRISSNIPVLGLAVDGEDKLYAAGSYQHPSADNTMEWPMGYVATWNGDTWTVLGRGFDRVNIYSLAVSPTGQVYVSGEQPRIPAGEYEGPAGFIAQWDSKMWNEIGTSALDSCTSITNLSLDGAGGLYAGCRGDGKGGLVFHWDGTDWNILTDQLRGEAPVIHDMAVDKSGQLYIGGSFDSVSGIPARNIASWDGNGWHALGDGLNGQVYVLAFDPGGELYASGILMEAGAQPMGQVARWDGETWHVPGP